MPKADATELAPKKSAATPSGPVMPRRRAYYARPISWVELLSGGLGLTKCEDRPAAFAGTLLFAVFGCSLGYRSCLHTRVSLSHLTGTSHQPMQFNPHDSEKPAGKDRENIGGNDREPLHQGLLTDLALQLRDPAFRPALLSVARKHIARPLAELTPPAVQHVGVYL